MNLMYFEDLSVGQKTIGGEHQTSKAEILEFALKWDRQPFHIDEEAAKSYPYGGLIAPLPYILAVVTKVSTTDSATPKWAVMGGLGYDKLRMSNPVRPGDLLTVTWEVIEKRESKSKPDRGIVLTGTEVRNQRNELVVSYISSSMIYKRPV
ncbi:MAG: MaoC/PaaZ C-terminal domain-containing protein [Dehalococcoidia bacterium]|nr:MaoC/PaaZ C-terminal domain-containing protein [Dehalococcoidia bacterium]